MVFLENAKLKEILEYNKERHRLNMKYGNNYYEVALKKNGMEF